MRPIHYNKINFKYKHSNYGLAPNFRFDGGVATVSDDLPNRILYGAVNIKSNIEKFTEDGAIFDDGSVLDNIDVVVLATGFKYSFPFLDDSIFEVDNHFPYLYELVFPVDPQQSTLAVVGLVQPFGGLPPILEIQARWACMVFTGKCTLPNPLERRRVVEERRQFLKTKYVDSPRYSLQVYFIAYIDKIASKIGCKPNLLKYFFTDPKLWYKIYFGPATPPQWRLCGPGKWDGARNAIDNVEYNTYYPMRTRKSGDGERDGLYDGWIKLLKRVFMFVIFLLLIRVVFFNGYNIFSIKV
jgi:dimethylaniline monooxygenase (N-oxide forming)